MWWKWIIHNSKIYFNYLTFSFYCIFGRHKHYYYERYLWVLVTCLSTFKLSQCNEIIKSLKTLLTPKSLLYFVFSPLLFMQVLEEKSEEIMHVVSTIFKHEQLWIKWTVIDAIGRFSFVLWLSLALEHHQHFPYTC